MGHWPLNPLQALMIPAIMAPHLYSVCGIKTFWASVIRLETLVLSALVAVVRALAAVNHECHISSDNLCSKNISCLPRTPSTQYIRLIKAVL